MTDLDPSPAGRSNRPTLVLLGALGLVAGLLLAFATLAGAVKEGETSAFDTAVVMAFRTPQNPDTLIGPIWLQEMGRDVTSLGSFVFLGFVYIAVVVYLMLLRRRGAAILMTAAVIGGTVLSTLLKMWFDRPRPDLASAARVFTASFPSGHATLSAVTFLTMGALLSRVEKDPRVKVYVVALAVFLTLVVGVSRVYLGLHYPSDVIAGWFVGCGWALLCWTVAGRAGEAVGFLISRLQHTSSGTPAA